LSVRNRSSHKLSGLETSIKISLVVPRPALLDFDQERGNIKCATSGVGNVKDFVDTAQALSGNRNQARGDRLIRAFSSFQMGKNPLLLTTPVWKI
jgi:hypothetical protein